MGAWWDSNSNIQAPADYQPARQQPKQNIFGNIFGAVKQGATNWLHGFEQHPAQQVYDTFAKPTVDLAKNSVESPIKAIIATITNNPRLWQEAQAQNPIAQAGLNLSHAFTNVSRGQDPTSALLKAGGDTGNIILNGLPLVGIGREPVKAVGQAVLKDTGESAVKSVAKTAGKTATENAVYGGASGLSSGAQTGNANNLIPSALLGATTGGLIGGGVGVLGGVASRGLLKASNDFRNITTAAGLNDVRSGAAAYDATAGKPLALPAGDSAKLGLPAGPEAPKQLPVVDQKLGLPTTTSANPVKTTADGAGVFGLHPDNPQLVKQIGNLQKAIDQYHNPGPDFQPLANYHNQVLNGTSALDSMAKMRADELRSIQKETGGVSLIKNQDGEVTGRASQNSPFYSNFYKQNGKPPTKADWLVEAHKELSTGGDQEAQLYQATMDQIDEMHNDFVQRYGQHPMTGDLQAPKVSKGQAAAAGDKKAQLEQQLGMERLGHSPETPAQLTPAPSNMINLDALLKAYDLRKNNGTDRTGAIALLNDIIQHPDASNELKSRMIDERASYINAGRQAKAPKATVENGKVTTQSAPKAAVTVEKGKVTTKSAKGKQDLLNYLDKKGEHSPAAQAAKDAERVASGEKALKAVSEANVSKAETTSGSTSTTPKSSKAHTTAPSGSRLEKVFDKVTGGKATGLVNPARAAARQGNTKFSRTATQAVANKRVITYQAKAAVQEFKSLIKGLNKDEVNAAIEGAKPTSSKVATAAKFFETHIQEVGRASVEAGTLKGTRENYLPRIAKGLDNLKGNGGKLSKNTRFNTERQTIEHIDASGHVIKEDKYKTINEFDAAIKALGGKGAERDPAKLLEHALISEGHAIENAKTLDRLMNTTMRDGRPALAKTTEANLSDQRFRGYSVIDNKLIHPEAKNLYEAISKTGRIDNPLAQALVKTNILSKRLVTINGIVHAVKIWQSSFASQGVRRSLWAIASPGASKQDFIRALGYGAKFARASNDNLFDEVGKATGLLGGLEKITDPLTHALFHNFGDRQGMSTFLYVEKSALKTLSKSLPEAQARDEAGRLAADAANQVMHFVPEDQQSVVVRQASQLAAFAGQFLQNTLKTATNAAGIGLDRTLSQEGQRTAQKLAIVRIGRMFAYSFASAQAINLAATGRYTWQNNNGDPLNPIWYVQKGKNGAPDKEYRITNHYGQLKDIAGFLTNPAQEIQNKLAPGARELIAQLSNVDLFTGDKIAKPTDGRLAQATDRMVHAASNIFTPAGINLSSPSKQPGDVQIAKYLGINSSSTKPNDHFDYAKYAQDKAAAQNGEAAWVAAGGSKLSFMQSQKAAGNSYFDKFFQSNPQLDPTSSQFNGKLSSTVSQSVTNGQIKSGMDAFKSEGGSSLAYMQAIKLSGSSEYDKFFAAHANLDPTSKQFNGEVQGGKFGPATQQAAARKEASYQNSKIKSSLKFNESKLFSKAKSRASGGGGGVRAAAVKLPKIKTGPAVKVPKARVSTGRSAFKLSGLGRTPKQSSASHVIKSRSSQSLKKLFTSA